MGASGSTQLSAIEQAEAETAKFYTDDFAPAACKCRSQRSLFVPLASVPKRHKHQVSQRQVREYSDSFSMFDQDRDGLITLEEMAAFMQRFAASYSEKDIKQMLKPVAIDGNGVIDFAEFAYIMDNLERELDSDSEAEELLDIFQQFDSDGDGRLNMAEIRRLVASLGESLSDADLHELGDPDDGELSYETFLDWMEDRSQLNFAAMKWTR